MRRAANEGPLEWQVTRWLLRVDRLEQAQTTRPMTLGRTLRHREFMVRAKHRADLALIDWARSTEYDPDNLPWFVE